jgi:hypothetical protein
MSDWNNFIVRGEFLFNQMVNSFNYMIQNNTINNFIIIDIRKRFSLEFINKFNQKEIQKELISWIKTEYIEDRLFQKNNWKPFRDLCDLCSAVLGYNKMFHYKNYYFQLIVDSEYYKNTLDDDNFVFFGLAIYGWKDDNLDMLQPDNKVIIPSDNIMPKWYWDIK